MSIICLVDTPFVWRHQQQNAIRSAIVLTVLSVTIGWIMHRNDETWLLIFPIGLGLLAVNQFRVAAAVFSARRRSPAGRIQWGVDADGVLTASGKVIAWSDLDEIVWKEESAGSLPSHLMNPFRWLSNLINRPLGPAHRIVLIRQSRPAGADNQPHPAGGRSDHHDASNTVRVLGRTVLIELRDYPAPEVQEFATALKAQAQSHGIPWLLD